jgi:hypothetical protein
MSEVVDLFGVPGTPPPHRRTRSRAKGPPPPRPTCQLVTCERPFPPGNYRRRYCSTECRMIAHDRPDLIRGTTRPTIRCAWCDTPAPNQYYPQSLRAIWPYLCNSCWAPLMGCRTRLRNHHVPIEALRDLAKDPTCRICGVNILEVLPAKVDKQRRTLLAIDHDHGHCPGQFSCGQCFRGFLCLRCNTLLGMADDDAARLQAASRYLIAYRAGGPLNVAAGTDQ